MIPVRRCTLLLLIGLSTAACSAQEALAPEDPEAAVEVEAEETSEQDSRPGLDRARDAAADRVQETTEWFDSFFGDERYDDEVASTRLRIEGAVEFTEGLTVDFSPKVKAQVALPRLEGQATILVIESLSPGDIQEDLTDGGSDLPIATDPDGEDQRGVSAALRWAAIAEERFNVSLDAGIRFTLPPEPFVKARIRHSFPLADELTLTTRQTPFWIIGGDGLGFTSGADFDRTMGQDLLLRFGGWATISTESDGIEWNVGPKLFFRPARLSALELRFTAAGRTQEAAILRNWRVQLRFRQSVFRPWLFYGIEPEVQWPKDEDRQFTPAVVLRLGVLLDSQNSDLRPSDLF